MNADLGLFVDYLRTQQYGKSRPIAWEVAPTSARSALVNRVMSVAHYYYYSRPANQEKTTSCHTICPIPSQCPAAPSASVNPWNSFSQVRASKSLRL